MIYPSNVIKRLFSGAYKLFLLGVWGCNTLIYFGILFCGAKPLTLSQYVGMEVILLSITLFIQFCVAMYQEYWDS